MPILVVCHGCKARFQVSEKFAGKVGPCPKCKAQITIPKLEEQVQIHAPEEHGSGGKTAAGVPVLKPIARKDTQLELVPTAMAACGALAVLVVAAVARKPLGELLWLRAIGLLAVSTPIAAAGYAFLRDAELEPYRGRWLWLRAGVCGLVYAGLWGGYYFIPPDLTQDSWTWFFVPIPFLLIGAGTAYVCLDLDIGNGGALFHYCFYVMMTLGLGWIAGMEMPWQRIVT